MWVDCKPIDDGQRSIDIIMLIHESHVFELRIKMKFEVHVKLPGSQTSNFVSTRSSNTRLSCINMIYRE